MMCASCKCVTTLSTYTSIKYYLDTSWTKWTTDGRSLASVSKGCPHTHVDQSMLVCTQETETMHGRPFVLIWHEIRNAPWAVHWWPFVDPLSTTTVAVEAKFQNFLRGAGKHCSNARYYTHASRCFASKFEYYRGRTYVLRSLDTGHTLDVSPCQVFYGLPATRCNCLLKKETENVSSPVHVQLYSFCDFGHSCKKTPCLSPLQRQSLTRPLWHSAGR